MTIDYKDKIRKLLALAESPVEAEAKSALLKARQLMAEYKLTEAELKEIDKQSVKNILTNINCSKRRNPWIVLLSSVIGQNYCCKGYRRYYKGKQTQYIGFIGLEDDVELCVTIFKYAVDCVLAATKHIKNENMHYGASYVKSFATVTVMDFAWGLTRRLQNSRKKTKTNGVLYW